MIKKLLLTLTFIALVTISFSGTTYAAQAGETVVVSEELIKLNNLYKEGVITEEEFSKAKSILLDPDSGTTKKKKRKWWQFPEYEKKPELTAVERRDLEELEKEELKAAKKTKKRVKKKKLTAAERRDQKEAEENKLKEERKELLAEKKAFREVSAEEKERILEEKRQACLDDPKTTGCDWIRVKNVLKFWK